MIYRPDRRFQEASLEKSIFDPRLAPAVEYLKNWDKQEANLILTGSVGIGKTYLACALLNDLWADLGDTGSQYKDLPVVHCRLKELIDSIRAEWNSKLGDYDLPPSGYKTAKFFLVGNP